jgi:non-ribosomal peptide synthetase component E (peptide arylation enzyme)
MEELPTTAVGKIDKCSIVKQLGARSARECRSRSVTVHE